MPKIVRSIRHAIIRRSVSKAARSQVTKKNRRRIVLPSKLVYLRNVRVAEQAARDRGEKNPGRIKFGYAGRAGLAKMHRMRFAHRQDAAIRYALRAAEIPRSILPSVRGLLRTIFKDPSFMRIERSLELRTAPVSVQAAHGKLVDKVGRKKATELLTWCNQKYWEI